MSNVWTSIQWSIRDLDRLTITRDFTQGIGQATMQATTQTKRDPFESLMCLEFASVAAGYSALGALTKDESLRILDASPGGKGRFVVIVMGAPQALAEGHERAKAALEGAAIELLVDHVIFESFDSRALEAVFSLAQAELGEALVVVETETVSGLLALTQRLVSNHELVPIDVRIDRASAGGGHAFFTGPSLKVGPAAEDARTLLRGALRQGKVEIVDQPSKTFRLHFNLSGHS